MYRTVFWVSFSAALFLAGPGCDAHRKSSPSTAGSGQQRSVAANSVRPEIGVVKFDPACSAAVKPAFNQALAMMHHMMYEQARDSFESIAERDPDCAMAHWGIATTLFQPLWGTRPDVDVLERGLSAISRADRVGTESPREQALIEATAAFFRKPRTADYAERERRWADKMEAAYRENPGDDDVAALYALSRLALAQSAEEPNELHDEAERVLRKVHARAPLHPGAIHYTIHADDADGRAKRNLGIVKKYSQIAPQVAHALHMPSHIYVRLGDWPSVIEWNERSAEAALAHKAGDEVPMHYLHAQDYLVYARLQRGEDNAARLEAERAFSKGRLQPTEPTAYHAAAIPARLAVERRDWDEAVELEPRVPEGQPWDSPLGLWAQSQTWLAKGLGAVHRDDADDAGAALERIQALRRGAEKRDERGFAKRIQVAELVLAGRFSHSIGESETAVRHIRKAAQLSQQLEKHPVSPGALLPPNEALGNLLLELKRPEEALAAYQAAEGIWPGRYHTRLGAARAAVAAGIDAEPYYRRFLESVGDSDREGVLEARRFLVAEMKRRRTHPVSSQSPAR